MKAAALSIIFFYLKEQYRRRPGRQNQYSVWRIFVGYPTNIHQICNEWVIIFSLGVYLANIRGYPPYIRRIILSSGGYPANIQRISTGSNANPQDIRANGMRVLSPPGLRPGPGIINHCAVWTNPSTSVFRCRRVSITDHFQNAHIHSMAPSITYSHPGLVPSHLQHSSASPSLLDLFSSPFINLFK